MLKYIIFLFIFLNSLIYSFSQVNFTKNKFQGTISFIELPDRLIETSGLIYFNGLLWTFNDSGGLPIIFGISPQNGEILQKVKIKNGRNFDWEDIAQDEKYIYIGDIGNNYNNRKKLKIYKILKSNITSDKRIKLMSEIITYSYSDQIDYKINRIPSFDCEALTSYNDSLLLFTKDWNDFNTSVYILSKNSVEQKANKIAVLNVNSLITGAEIINDEGIILLSGRNNMYPLILVLKYINNNNKMTFNDGVIYEMPFLKGSQIEAITYANGTIYISSEKSLNPQRIYKISNFNF